MVNFVVEVADLDLVSIDRNRHAPVLGYEQAPCAFAVTRQKVGLLSGHGLQFVLVRDVLQERDHPPDLANHGGL